MATIIGEAGGWLMDQINDFMADELVSQISTSEANRLWMLPLLVRKARGKRGMSKDNSVGSKANDYNKATTKTLPSGSGESEEKFYPFTNPVRQQVINTGSAEISWDRGISTDPRNTRNFPNQVRGWAGVSSLDLTNVKSLFEQYKPSKNKIVIMNVSTDPYTALELQNRPPELDIDPRTTWVEVKSMARNSPFMFYTGSRDIIQFDISWYSNQPDRRDDVLLKCKLLESWSKSNGYYASPPVLKIHWGANEVFKDYYFILTSAKYTLSNFQDSCVEDVNSGFEYDDNGIATGYNAPGIISSQYDARMNSRLNIYRNGKSPEFVDLKLYPSTAVQHLVFQRVSTTQVTYAMTFNYNKLAGIDGIDSLSNTNKNAVTQ